MWRRSVDSERESRVTEPRKEVTASRGRQEDRRQHELETPRSGELVAVGVIEQGEYARVPRELGRVRRLSLDEGE
jgi:hypothetical protein